MRTPFILAALVIMPGASVGPFPFEKFDIDNAHSEITFSIRFMGLTNVHGRFKGFRGSVMYVESDVARSTVGIMIDVKTLDTGNDWRDRDLKGPAFFNADTFPTITFKSTRVERSADGFVVRGPLTMRGVTREVVIPFLQLHGKMKDAWGNTRVGFAGALKLNRKDFGVVGGGFWNQIVDLTRQSVADTVAIELSVQAEQINFDRISFGARPNTKSLGDTLFKLIAAQGTNAALAQYETLRKDTVSFSTGEAQLNTLGYKLLQAGKVDDAIRVLRLNVAAFPASANVYDSLGEACLAKGDRAGARENYAKALELDANNVGATEVLRWLTN